VLLILTTKVDDTKQREHKRRGNVAYSLEQAMAEFFDNSGGTGVVYGGTGQGGNITGNPTGGGGSGSSYGRYHIGADGTLYLRNHRGEYVHVGSGESYTGPVRDWTEQGEQYVTHILGARSENELSQIAKSYFGKGGTTYIFESGIGNMAFLNVYRLRQSDGTYTYGFCDGIYLYEAGGQAVRGVFPICPAWYQGGIVGGVLGVNYAPKFKVADGVPFMTTTVGQSGDDELTGEGWLIGGSGSDTLNGGSEADILEGGADTDMLKGGGGADYLDGGEGYDGVSFAGAAGGVTINLATNQHGGYATGVTIVNVESVQATAFADTLTGRERGNGQGVDLHADGGNDTLIGSAGQEGLFGGEGDDWFDGRDGADTIHGWTGHDAVHGGDGNDSVYGGEGNDWLSGGDGADLLDGGADWDTVSYLGATSGVVVDLTTNGNGGAAAGDVISGVEVLQGSHFDDRLTSIDRGHGQGGQLYGEGGSDQLYGKNGGDCLFGGAGNDWLDGGFGGDILTGARGRQCGPDPGLFLWRHDRAQLWGVRAARRHGDRQHVQARPGGHHGGAPDRVPPGDGGAVLRCRRGRRGGAGQVRGDRQPCPAERRQLPGLVSAAPAIPALRTGTKGAASTAPFSSNGIARSEGVRNPGASGERHRISSTFRCPGQGAWASLPWTSRCAVAIFRATSRTPPAAAA
jgi:Ca2+-binding RTX toxin-like protein